MADERHPKRICEACLQFDDHPRHVIGVTSAMALGNHSQAEVLTVMRLVEADLPADLNSDPEGWTPEQLDAAKAVADMLDAETATLHFDCSRALEAANQMPAGVARGAHADAAPHLRGDELRAHLIAQPAPVEA